MQNKKNIAVIFGGRSSEHDVSIITAHAPIIDSLSMIPYYNVVPVYISQDGVWYSNQEMMKLEYFKDKDYKRRLKASDIISLTFGTDFLVTWPGIFGKSLKIDLVFPAMHGTYGEDGSLTGLLRMANVPFVGCDIFASAVAMDKVLTKQILQAENLPVTKYIWFTKSDWETDKSVWIERARDLVYPLFVKPVHLGSSIGISKVNNVQELENAIEVACFYDNKVLVEEGVKNLVEITLPIVGNEDLEFAHIERPLNKSDFFDFQEKYIGTGGKKGADGVNQNYSQIPANLRGDLSDRALDLGGKVFKILGLSGISRIDFLINSGTDEIFVNEVNPLPGGLYEHNFKKKGISSLELVKKLVRMAEEKFNAQQKINFTFNSRILEVVSGSKLGNSDKV
jgi:D-alanine-D-alanine ligase